MRHGRSRADATCTERSKHEHVFSAVHISKKLLVYVKFTYFESYV